MIFPFKLIIDIPQKLSCNFKLPKGRKGNQIFIEYIWVGCLLCAPNPPPSLHVRENAIAFHCCDKLSNVACVSYRKLGTL